MCYVEKEETWDFAKPGNQGLMVIACVSSLFPRSFALGRVWKERR
jgi:hypothetical protein